MEQRRLRLGDILDDYCPRERRVTNHAVVAMIEEKVKQTRCTTCDAEHVYKGGKEPRRRKKDGGTALYEEVLAGMSDASEGAVPRSAAAEANTVVERTAPVAAEVQAFDADPESSGVQEQELEPEPEPEIEVPEPQIEDGPFHRRLIRATLPRPEGQKEVRQVTDFTIRQNGGRASGHNPYRGDRSQMRSHGPSGIGGGNGPQGGSSRRFAGGGNPGAPGGRGRGGGRPGFGGSNQQRQGGGSGRKRSR